MSTEQPMLTNTLIVLCKSPICRTINNLVVSALILTAQMTSQVS